MSVSPTIARELIGEKVSPGIIHVAWQFLVQKKLRVSVEIGQFSEMEELPFTGDRKCSTRT